MGSYLKPKIPPRDKNAFLRVVGIVDLILYNLVKYIGAGLLIAMVVTVFMQVLFRYIIRSPLPWAEELARALFLWSSVLGATLAVRAKAHPSLDIVVNLLPRTPKMIISSLVNVAIVVSLYILADQGIALTITAGRSVMPTLRISMSYVFASIPTGAILMIAFYCIRFIHRFAGERSGS